MGNERLPQQLVCVSWSVSKLEDGLESCDFELVSGDGGCSLPLLWLEDLFEKFGTLNVLRTKRHRLKDSFELVKFIEEEIE